MKKVALILGLVCVSVVGNAQKKVPVKAPVAEKAPVIKSLIDSVSYLVGASIADNIS